jgi:hypothetical protein
MSARPVRPLKPAALDERCSTGVPLIQVFREVPASRWFWVRLVGHDAPIYRPMVPITRLCGGGPQQCQCMPSRDGPAGTYRTPMRAALGRTKEQVCTASASMAPRCCRDGGSLGPQGYVALALSEGGQMPESPVRSAPAPGIEAMCGLSAVDCSWVSGDEGGDSGLYPIGHVHTACWRGVPW